MTETVDVEVELVACTRCLGGVPAAIAQTTQLAARRHAQTTRTGDGRDACQDPHDPGTSTRPQ